jgi:HlyD family secretion protein
MKVRSLMSHRFVTSTLKLLLAALLIGVVVYRVKLAPMAVEGHEMSRTSIVSEVMGTGTLEARMKTTISPRIQERLAELFVDQNDVVRAGQLLARLDDGELLQQVEMAAADLETAKASAERVRMDEARSQAVEEQARLEHKRILELQTTQVTSQSDLDKAVEQLRVAQADLRRAGAAIVESERRVITAEKNLAHKRELLGYSRILSPYDGLIVRRDRDPGDVVVPGSSILRLICTKEIWVSAWVDETASGALAQGQPAQVVFRSHGSRVFAGAVARLGRETDRETREFLVDVRVDELPENWTIGQRAEVFIETGRKADALALPQQFIGWRGNQPGVFVMESGKARWRPVEIGLRGREMVEISQGLSAGERVVRAVPRAKQELADGRRIFVR